MSIEIKITNRKDVAFPIFINDTKGNRIYCQSTLNGFTWELTMDKNGNRKTYKDSAGRYEIKGKEVTKNEYNSFLNKGLIIEPKEVDNKDKLIQIQKETIEDYRRLVVKYKESESLRDRLIENQKKQIANQLEIINLLSDAIR
jgi:hypothetical protein